ILLAGQALAVGRIGHQPAAVRSGRRGTCIADLETYRTWCKPGAIQIRLCRFDCGGVEVVSNDGTFEARGDAGTRFILEVAPMPGVVIAQSLETKWTPYARRHAQRYPCTFDQYRAAAA